MSELDPNSPTWQRSLERDASARFPGRPDPHPFGSCLYLWGETPVYCVRFQGWTPLSAPLVATKLREARAEVDESCPGSRLAYYLLLGTDILDRAVQEIVAECSRLRVGPLLLLISAHNADWPDIRVSRIVHI